MCGKGRGAAVGHFIRVRWGLVIPIRDQVPWFRMPIREGKVP